METSKTPFYYKVSVAIGAWVLATAENLFGRFAPAVYPENTHLNFNWVAELEKQTPHILKEYEEYVKSGRDIPALSKVSYGQQLIEHDNKWLSLFLVAFNRELKDNTNSFKATMHAVNRIPGLNTVFFSVMKPGTEITPHKGLYKGLLRLHLGLVVPENNQQLCALISNGKKYNWQVGKAFVFDDTLEHSAYNRSEEVRVVLLVDFERPLPPVLRILNRALLYVIGRSAYIQTLIKNLEEQHKH